MTMTEDNRRMVWVTAVRCAATAGALGLMLSGCTPVQTLDTRELRAAALQEELTELADAVASFDTSAIKKMQCREPWYIELPRKEQLGADVSLPLEVEVRGAEPLDLSSSTYTDPDPDAEFHIAGLRDARVVAIGDRVALPDVVVRIDDRRACVWSLGPSFILLLGL